LCSLRTAICYLATANQMIAWQLLMEEIHRQNLNVYSFIEVAFISSSYFGFPVSYVDNICIRKKATVCKLCNMCVSHILPLAAGLTWQGISAGTTKTKMYLLNQQLFVCFVNLNVIFCEEDCRETMAGYFDVVSN